MWLDIILCIYFDMYGGLCFGKGFSDMLILFKSSSILFCFGYCIMKFFLDMGLDSKEFVISCFGEVFENLFCFG